MTYEGTMPIERWEQTTEEHQTTKTWKKFQWWENGHSEIATDMKTGKYSVWIFPVLSSVR